MLEGKEEEEKGEEGEEKVNSAKMKTKIDRFVIKARNVAGPECYEGQG